VIKVLVFENVSARGGVYQCGRDSYLRGRFVRYPSVSLSLTLSRNEKVEQHIRKKTHKPNALRFWVKGGVISLYGLAKFSFFEISPVFLPRIFPTSGIRADDLRLGRVQFDLVSKVFLTWVSENLKMLPLEGECTNVKGTLT